MKNNFLSVDYQFKSDQYASRPMSLPPVFREAAKPVKSVCALSVLD